MHLCTAPVSIVSLYELPDEALLTTREAAVFLNMKEATLIWYRCQRSGPSFMRLGAKMIRYKVGDLKSYIEGDK